MSDKPTRWFRELDAANVHEYAVLIYETWYGDDREDPATKIEEWMSVFKQEDMPEEYDNADNIGRTAPYLAEDDRYSYRTFGEFGGLKKAVNNQLIKVVKETDRDAVKHQQESEAMLPKDDDGGYHNRYRQQGAGGVHYEDFLAAIDRVAADDKDKEAWDIINKWRERALRQEERSI